MADNSYEIRRSNGTVLGQVSDVGNATANSITDTTLSSLQLLRRGAKSYSQASSENFFHLLENFAKDSAPVRPSIGQLWYDSSAHALKVYHPQIGSQAAGFYNITGSGLALGLANAVSINLSGDVIGTGQFNGIANSTITANLSNTGVAAGTYYAPIITVDAGGRILTATSPGPANSDYAAIANAIGGPPATVSNSVQKTGGTMTGTLNLTNANVNATGTGKIMEGNAALIPRGVIVMWTGNATNVPAGWAVCNGITPDSKTPTVPDLRARFVIGGTDTGTTVYGQTGGNATVNVSTGFDGGHSHDITVADAGGHNHTGQVLSHALTVAELPSHTHGLASATGGVPRIGTGYGYSGTAGVTGVAVTATDPVGSGVAHSHQVSADGVHKHVVMAANSPVHSHSVTFDNRPAYYALAFIMKL